MTKEEALEMLKSAPRGENASNVNAYLTQAQCVGIVENAIRSLSDGYVLDHLTEKRVHQVCKNQRRPRF